MDDKIVKNIESFESYFYGDDIQKAPGSTGKRKVKLWILL